MSENNEWIIEGIKISSKHKIFVQTVDLVTTK